MTLCVKDFNRNNILHRRQIDEEDYLEYLDQVLLKKN